MPLAESVALVAVALLGGALAGFFIRRGNSEVSEPLALQPVTTITVDRFDRLVRALPLGVIMLDRDSRITFANRAAASIFGFAVERAFGHHVIEVVPSIELEHRVTDALGGESSMGPLIVTGKAGNRTYAISAYPLTDGAKESDDVTIGALVLAEDQTELLAMERARQEFLSNVSHELRTPLSSIKLMLETVNDSPDDEVRDLFLPQALAQVDRLASLVRKLLEEARAMGGRLSLKYERASFSAVVKPIVASFEQAAAGKGVELRLQSATDATVDLDRDRFSQVLVNLIDNGLRYTQPGGSVTVTTKADEQWAILRVVDTGIGIPYRDLPHIFERFYVVDRSRAREVSGEGLGLSIVKQIVEAHHGTITAESLLGSGTKFTCRIPRRAPHDLT